MFLSKISFQKNLHCSLWRYFSMKYHAFAYNLPKDYSEERLQTGIRGMTFPNAEVRVIKDTLGKSSGKARISYNSQDDLRVAINKLHIKSSLDNKFIKIRGYDKLRNDPDKEEKLMKRLTIYNLSYKASVKDIEQVVGEFGRIEEIRIPRNHDGYPHGYAFVFMHSEKDIKRVLDYADERHIHNRQIRIFRYQKDENKVQREMRKRIYSETKVTRKFNLKDEDEFE
ncbi:unnamed protein product [Moneuplotes crassus]|uniref:RRM domain-containing protein n=1 Tax=Euplotes crassus TaxID=5936 RepID=A0AAD1XYL5_EUPCR|nr:unnamed protein product [Moneuplotes crassus]